jgi:tetratricopeptide (TPR) repeat protein
VPLPPKDAPTTVARYDEGRRALSAGRFTEAERAFTAVLQQQPGFRDTEALLAQARDGQVSARQKALADGRAFEASGDWARAIAAYERAGAADMAGSARTKMTAAGDDAYRKARQFDARNRPGEATTWYERAVQWLPDSDARKATAQERLAALKGGGA